MTINRVDLSVAQQLACEIPLWRDRLMRAGLYRTAHAMQAAQDEIAKELEAALESQSDG